MGEQFNSFTPGSHRKKASVSPSSHGNHGNQAQEHIRKEKNIFKKSTYTARVRFTSAACVLLSTLRPPQKTTLLSVFNQHLQLSGQVATLNSKLRYILTIIIKIICNTTLVTKAKLEAGRGSRKTGGLPRL